MRWDILESEYILKNKWLTVRRDHVKMPTGIIIPDYYILEYPNWVNVLAITDDDKYIIEQQYRHGTQSIDYELCAGTFEPGETPLEAAQRELIEETGYTGGEWELYCLSTPNPAAMTNTNYSFIAKGVKYSGCRQLDRTEDIKILLVDYEHLKKLVTSNQIKQGQMLAPLWKYIAEHK